MSSLPSRKQIRHAVADLVRNQSMYRDDADFQVFSHEARDFGSDIRHAIVVTSASSHRPSLSLTKTRSTFRIGVEIWVLFRDPDSNWSEQDAEDRLDDTEADVASVFATNRSNRPLWNTLSYEQNSLIDRVTVGGRSYLYEVLTLTVEVL